MGFNVPDESEPIDGPAREHPMDLCRRCDSPRKVHLGHAGPGNPVATDCRKFEPRCMPEPAKPEIERIADRVLASEFDISRSDGHALARYIKAYVGRVFMVEPVPVKLNVEVFSISDRTHNLEYGVNLKVGDEVLFSTGARYRTADVAARVADEFRMKLGLMFEYEVIIQKLGAADVQIKLLASNTKDALAKLVDQLGEHALAQGVKLRKVE